MGIQHSHLREDQRKELYKLKQAGKGAREISDTLGCHRSTIYREIKSNSVEGYYLPDSAHKQAQSRRNRPGSKIERSSDLQKTIETRIKMGWSPKAIAGRLELDKGRQIISHESIYKWIYKEGSRLQLYKKLARKKVKRGRFLSKRQRTSKIKNRTSIHERPDITNDFGHWEGDLVLFKGHKGAVVTLYEKKSKVLIAKKLTSKNTQSTIDCIMDSLIRLPKSARKTITFDNGLEFAAHNNIQKNINMKTYFCDPYAAWQKGGIENANGILRRFMPKKTLAQDVSPSLLGSWVQRINRIPRKSLNFLSPYEFFLQAIDPHANFYKLNL